MRGRILGYIEKWSVNTNLIQKRYVVIGIVDYGVANLGSIRNMLNKLGVQAEVIIVPSALEQADKIILPGVGTFDYGMSALASR